MLPLDAPIEDVSKKYKAKVFGWVLAAAILFGWGVYNWLDTYGKGYVDFFLFRLNYKQFCFFQAVLLSGMSAECYRREKSGKIHWYLPVILFGLSAILVWLFSLSYQSLARLVNENAEFSLIRPGDTWISVIISLLFASEIAFAIVLIFRKKQKTTPR